MVFANSTDNRIIGNSIRDGRIGMEFIFSPGNEVRDNEIVGNVTGIVVIYSDELTITGNRMLKLRQHTGFGLSIKESSHVLVENNELVHCAIGFVVNAPIHPENITQLRNNLFAYNEAAMFFYGDRGGHVIEGNRFDNNHTDVLVSSASSAVHNKWLGNIWDSYQGFDQDQDGVGDVCDNCPDTPNPNQADTDGDGLLDRVAVRYEGSKGVLEFERPHKDGMSVGNHIGWHLYENKM